jgi:predicted ATPase
MKKKEDVEQRNHLLRNARKDKNLSQQELANILGLDNVRSLRRWELGQSFPQPLHQRKLVEFFGKSLAELGLLTRDSVDITPENIEPSSQDLKNTSTNMDVEINIGNIIPWFTSFVGRTEEIARLRELLARPEVRMVTLLGPGGIGKTRLAVELARASQDDFLDGISLISLSAIHDPALVPPTIAKELQIPEDNKVAFLETLQSFFKNRRFLLILDNFEYVLAASTFIEQLLSGCPDLKVLVTSQVVLHLQAEYEFALDPFPLPEQDAPSDTLLDYDAIQLFIQRARAKQASFQVTPENLSLISKICICLDGSPLAIEMAAALVKVFRLPSLLQTISQQRLPILKNSLKKVPIRHQTLFDTIKRSYNLLNEQEQWFFRYLAVFPGGCSWSAARKLGDISPFQGVDVLDILISLLDKNMIRPGIQEGDLPFFSMLETIREYGVHTLQELGEWETARHTQSRYYLALLEEAENNLKGVQQGEWLMRLDNEKVNLCAALTWLIECRETEKALSFCEVFGKYCGLRGYWSEELYWLETVLALSKTEISTKLYGRVLRRVGYIIYRFRDLVRAGTFFEESAAISGTFNDLSNMAGAFSGLAWVYYRQGNISAAKQFFQKSVDTARKSEDKWSLANALESLSKFTYAQGDLNEAEIYAKESIILARMTEDRESLVRQISALIPIKIAQKQFEEAEALAQEIFAFTVALGNKPLTCIALTCLVDTALTRNKLEDATNLCESCIRLAHELNDKSTIAYMKLKLSQIALQQTKVEQAVIFALESQRLFQALGDKPNDALASHYLADINQHILSLKLNNENI